MKFRIHFEHVDGSEDSFVIVGDDLEQLRGEADEGVAKRKGLNPWSEEIKEATRHD